MAQALPELTVFLESIPSPAKKHPAVLRTNSRMFFYSNSMMSAMMLFFPRRAKRLWRADCAVAPVADPVAIFIQKTCAAVRCAVGRADCTVAPVADPVAVFIQKACTADIAVLCRLYSLSLCHRQILRRCPPKCSCRSNRNQQYRRRQTDQPSFHISTQSDPPFFCLFLSKPLIPTKPSVSRAPAPPYNRASFPFYKRPQSCICKYPVPSGSGSRPHKARYN